MHIVEKEEAVLNSINITLFSIHQEIDTENKINDRDSGIVVSQKYLQRCQINKQKRENIS